MLMSLLEEYLSARRRRSRSRVFKRTNERKKKVRLEKHHSLFLTSAAALCLRRQQGRALLTSREERWSPGRGWRRGRGALERHFAGSIPRFRRQRSIERRRERRRQGAPRPPRRRRSNSSGSSPSARRAAAAAVAAADRPHESSIGNRAEQMRTQRLEL